MSDKLAPTRPYAPTVHALILPSQFPIDLRLTFRDLDEVNLVRWFLHVAAPFPLIPSQNGGSPPEHMNLLTAKEAFEHVGNVRCES